jgi:hypothetical protein
MQESSEKYCRYHSTEIDIVIRNTVLKASKCLDKAKGSISEKITYSNEYRLVESMIPGPFSIEFFQENKFRYAYKIHIDLVSKDHSYIFPQGHYYHLINSLNNKLTSRSWFADWMN